MARVSRRKANSKNTNRNSVRRNNNRNNRNMGNKSKRRNNNKRSKNKRSRSKGSRRRRKTQRGGEEILCSVDVGLNSGVSGRFVSKDENQDCASACGTQWSSPVSEVQQRDAGGYGWDTVSLESVGCCCK